MPKEDWTFSRHAIQRAVDMAIDPDELRQVIHHPHLVRPFREYPDCMLHTNGRVAIAVNPYDKIVITVMWDSRHGRFDRNDMESEMERIRDKP